MPSDLPHVFPIPPARILDLVAAAYSITVADLISHGQIRPRGEARRVAYQLLHDEARLSWPGVGKIMNHHHTTALTQARTADPAAVDQLRARLYLNGQGSLW
jgi:chromosomal replication initiation ATPase DnaA